MNLIKKFISLFSKREKDDKTLINIVILGGPIAIELGCSGLCALLYTLEWRNHLTRKEHKRVRKILAKEFNKKEKYKDFPFLVDSEYYFEKHNWDVRIKWLNEILKNI